MALYINSTDVNEITEVIGEASMSVLSAYNDGIAFCHNDEALSPDKIAESLDQFIDILLLVEVDRNNSVMFQDIPQQLDDSILCDSIRSLDPAEISEIGNHGLNLLQTLSDWAFSLHLPEEQQKIQYVMVAVSLWVARHGGTLERLESVVSTITALANSTTDPELLTELSHAMGELINAVDDDVKESTSVHVQAKSWRALNISRGIIATRSYNIEVMENVFDQLVQNLPDDAPVFFEEGLQQMDMLDYPAHVKDVMVKYFRQHTTQVLH